MAPHASHVVVRQPVRSVPIAAGLLVLMAGCLSAPSGGETVASPRAHASSIEFSRTAIDVQRLAQEPALQFASNGDAYVCAPHGPGKGSDLWRRLAGSSGFEYVGMPLLPPYYRGPVLRSGTGDVGGGDCDVAVDSGGRVYFVDGWVGSLSVSSSDDRGRTWRGVPLTLPYAPLDRPWAVGGAPDEVFISAAEIQYSDVDGGLGMPPVGGIWVARSTDGGLTFPQQVLAVSNGGRIGLNGNIAAGAGSLYVVYSEKVGEGKLAMMVAVSSDHGMTWEQREVARQDFYPGQCLSPLDVFPVVAADESGGVYLAWVLINPQTQRQDLFFASSSDSGKSWSSPSMLTDRAGTREFPWLVVGSPSRVGVVWYETNVTRVYHQTDALDCGSNFPPDAEWFLHYAFSSSARDASPAFVESIVQPDPVSVGDLPYGAGEFPQVEFDPAGHAAIAYVANLREGKSLPVFALQETGPVGRVAPASPSGAARGVSTGGLAPSCSPCAPRWT